MSGGRAMKDKKIEKPKGYVLMEDGTRLYIADSEPGRIVECPDCRTHLLVGETQYREGWTCPCGVKLIGRQGMKGTILAKLKGKL
jgi:sugar lactone lactonase YvrE